MFYAIKVYNNNSENSGVNIFEQPSPSAIYYSPSVQPQIRISDKPLLNPVWLEESQ